MTTINDSGQTARRLSTVRWVLVLATVGLIFDGYDLVVYGAVVSTFLRDASQIGTVTPAIAGALGSYALFGVALGALLAGSVGDIIGRRKVMLTSYAWFSIGMALTALSNTTREFGWMRFVTGVGIGSLVATTAALVAEYAPKDKKNLYIAISNGGIPLGSMLSAVLAIVAVVGLGTNGTQTLIYGFVANYYRTNVRAAGVAWCAGFGRIGGIGGPILGSFLIGAGLELDYIFYILAGLGLLGVALTLLVPMSRSALAQPASNA